MTYDSECGAVIEMPSNQRQAASLLRGDPAKVVIGSTGSRSPARTMTDPQPGLFLSRTTERKNNILRTAATWSPLAYCDGFTSLDATVYAVTGHADNLVERKLWLAALAYSLTLPHHSFQAADLLESALELGYEGS